MNDELAATANRQYGLFTTRQALAAGYTYSEQHNLVRRGEWQRVTQGVLSRQLGEVGLEQSCRALCLIGGAEVSIGGRAGLAVLGVGSAEPVERIEVVVPPGHPTSHRRGVVFRHARLPTMQVRSMRLVIPPVAAVRVARTEDRLVAIPILDEVMRKGLATIEELEALVDALAPGARGRRRAISCLQAADGAAESKQESRLRVLLMDAEFPGLVSQHEVFDASGVFVARLDFAIVQLRIAIEYDGRQHRDDHSAFVGDRRRQNRLVNLGWRVLRFTAEDLAKPGYVLDVIQQCVRERSRQLGVPQL